MSSRRTTAIGHVRGGSLGFAALAIAAAMALLAGRILRLSRVDHLIGSDPGAALVIAPLNARALVSAAETDLEARPPRLASASVLLARAAGVDPLNAQIYSDMARVALGRGDTRRAGALFELAAERSRRLAAPEFWAFGQAAKTRDYGKAWDAFDIVSRTQPGAVSARLFPTAAIVAATPGGLASLSRRLATDPPWRAPFLLELGRRPATSGVLALILSDLRDTAHPATDEETRGLLNGIIATGAYQSAYATWIQLLPAKRLAAMGALYNGRFEADAGEVPFNWTVPEDATGLAALGAGEAATQMRVVPFDRSEGAAFVGQLLALTPGDYNLRGSVRNSSGGQAVDDGLAWVLRCADTGRVLAMSDPVAVADAWTRFVMPFTIPSGSCQGQWLELHPRPSLTSTTQNGPVWFDDFSIAPARGPT